MKRDKSFTVVDNLQPAEIITEHIRKIMNDETLSEYTVDIDKLEDLLATEIDDEYEKDEKKIKKEVDAYVVSGPLKMNRESSEEYQKVEAATKSQYKKRLVFRALIRLAKRKGLWLMDEEDAVISHDKKKVTSTAST